MVGGLGSSMVEQLTLNQLVSGSSPDRGTTSQLRLINGFLCCARDDQNCHSGNDTKTPTLNGEGSQKAENPGDIFE